MAEIIQQTFSTVQIVQVWPVLLFLARWIFSADDVTHITSENLLQNA